MITQDQVAAWLTWPPVDPAVTAIRGRTYTDVETGVVSGAYPHQVYGACELANDVNPARGRVIPKAFGLLDQVGAGKTKQVIDAANILYDVCEKAIDTVVVVVPAYARSVWLDPDPVIGEIAKHAWDDVRNVVHEYHVKNPRLDFEPGLNWVITNYEFIRNDKRFDDLVIQLRKAKRKVWLVCDESWNLANHKAVQAKAIRKLRRKSERVTIMNGSDSEPFALFSQARILHPDILGGDFYLFRAQYAIMGGYRVESKYQKDPRTGEPLKIPTTVIGWRNLDEIREKLAPYVVSRKTRDCIDLPPILEPITIDAPLSEKSWAAYTSMRDDLVVWLDAHSASTAKQAIVKVLRLAQITAGHIGGVEQLDTTGTLLDYFATPGVQIRDLGYEKIDAARAWLKTFTPPMRVLVWCRFRHELATAAERFRIDTLHVDGEDHRQPWDIHKLQGQQDPEERLAAKKILAPDTLVTRPTLVVGNPQAGGAALNLAGASLAITLSRDSSLKTMLQKDGRIDRPGQRHPIQYADVVATGPRGQKTIDHHILKALRSKDDIAKWTAAKWRQIIAT